MRDPYNLVFVYSCAMDVGGKEYFEDEVNKHSIIWRYFLIRSIVQMTISIIFGGGLTISIIWKTGSNGAPADVTCHMLATSEIQIQNNLKYKCKLLIQIQNQEHKQCNGWKKDWTKRIWWNSSLSLEVFAPFQVYQQIREVASLKLFQVKFWFDQTNCIILQLHQSNWKLAICIMLAKIGRVGLKVWEYPALSLRPFWC